MLRTVLTCAFMICASAAYAVNPPAPAEDASGLVLHSTLSSVTGENSGITAPIADVKPGETLTITGACVMQVNSADNLRVVLTLADSAAEMPGYHVLATDQAIGGGGLQVRVPDLPETADRIFMVKVFHLGHEAPEICDAGSIRIGAAPLGKVG